MKSSNVIYGYTRYIMNSTDHVITFFIEAMTVQYNRYIFCQVHQFTKDIGAILDLVRNSGMSVPFPANDPMMTIAMKRIALAFR